MMIGSGGNPDNADCVLIIHAAVERGINFVDTADLFRGKREEIVGNALLDRRDNVVPDLLFILGTGIHDGGNAKGVRRKRFHPRPGSPSPASS
jgi:diketogulonate reductase-like aldo/keto reductase